MTDFCLRLSSATSSLRALGTLDMEDEEGIGEKIPAEEAEREDMALEE